MLEHHAAHHTTLGTAPDPGADAAPGLTHDDRPTRRRPVRSRWTALSAAVALMLIAAGCIPAAGTVPISSAPEPTGCITDVSPTDKRVYTECGGDVTYNVSVPDRCMEFACGLIVDVHGWTMSGDIQEQNTGIAAIGRDEGYIVIQPNAPGDIPSWSSAHYPHVAAFAELAVDAWRVDERRVHMTGFSQGGAMTFWMRCNRADLFVSAAPTALSGSACADGTNMPTLYVQGNDDIFVSPAAITNTINSFRNTHGLTEEAVIELPEVVLTGYSSPERTTPGFTTVIHDYSAPLINGHCFMGSMDPSSLYGCDQPAPIGHGRLVVDFFKSNPRSE